MAGPAEVEKGTGVRLLALCGESLLIAALEASLRGHKGVEIVLLDTPQPGAAQALEKLSPDIIIFDLTPSQLSGVFTFLRTHKDVVLIGLDMHSELALFLSGEWRLLPTLKDLMQMIEAQLQVKAAGDE